VEVRREVLPPRAAHPGLTGLVEHDVDAREERVEVDLGERRANQVETLPEAREVLLLAVHLVVVGHRVDPDDVPALGEQARADRRTHEARGPRHERLHRDLRAAINERTATTAKAGPRTR